MVNPFVYGEAVTGKSFANRERELRELIRDLMDCERVFLISPRRYGKTSLILNVLQELRAKGIYTAYVDLYKAASVRKFLELYTQAIAGAVETKLDKVVKLFKDIVPSLRPKVTIGADGSPTIGIDYIASERDTLKFLDEVYDTPEKLAIKRRRKFVVVFDEFQEVRNLGGERIEKAMRASFQHHTRVAYLFAGSKRHMLYEMVSNRNRAFYKMGKVINLGKIPRLEFSKFLKEAFIRTGFTVESGLIDKVLDIVEDYPYNAQFLCHELWDNNLDSKEIKIGDIELSLNKILAQETPIYIGIWDSLSLHQRRVLQSIACYGGKKVFSQSFILSNDLGALSSVQTSIRLLMKKGILDKENDTYVITDVFFKEWIKRKI